MREKDKMSLLVRVASGALGLLGFAAIAINVAHAGEFNLDIKMVASFFGGYIFLFAALFGRYPWDKRETGGSDE